MGEWLMPDPAVLLTDVLGSPAFEVPAHTRTALAAALRETGFLVPTAYYVPDTEELYDMYRKLGEIDYHAGRSIRRSLIRWVMCGETQLALQRKYGNERTVHTPNLSAFVAGADLNDEVLPELHMVMTTRAAASIPTALDAGRLFGMPIRRDPAARRPLFETIPKEDR